MGPLVLWGRVAICAQLHNAQIATHCFRAAKHILCSLPLQATVKDVSFGNSVMCSLVKSYFSHMSNDAVGCGWGEPTCHLGTTSTNCTKHLHDTPVRYTCEIRALDRADVRRLEVQLPSGLTAQCTYFTPLHPTECCS